MFYTFNGMYFRIKGWPRKVRGFSRGGCKKASRGTWIYHRGRIKEEICTFRDWIVLVPVMVYCMNGASDFWSAFWQMTEIFMIGNIFDRLFIDEFWVGHTKAWIIPGTEDLMPYIPVKVKIKKWVSTLIMFPLFSALIAGAVTFFTK